MNEDINSLEKILKVLTRNKLDVKKKERFDLLEIKFQIFLKNALGLDIYDTMDTEYYLVQDDRRYLIQIGPHEMYHFDEKKMEEFNKWNQNYKLTINNEIQKLL